MKTIVSPCIHVCAIDENRQCVGCFRTLTEISNWLVYSDEEREQILKDLPRRQEELF